MDVKSALIDFNPWWKAHAKSEYRERELFSRLEKFMELPQILAFTGLRRVGKTTLLMKIKDDAIEKGLNPFNVVYFSFDGFENAEVGAVLGEYEKITEKRFGAEKTLLLLDEVQKLGDWENQVKHVYDLFGKKAKIIISGSESLFIRKKSRETLGGRLFEFRVDPLSFGEFLLFKNAKFEPIGLYEKELRLLLKKYVLSQGLPEMADVEDKEVIRKYVRESIIEKVVYRDIPKMFKVKYPEIIEAILNIILEEPGQIIDFEELGRELKTTRQTISNYIHYLEQSFLVKKLYNYSKNRRKIQRKLKKYYPTLISPTLAFNEDDYSQSKVFEWLLVTRLNAEFFWRDQYQNEVDVVLPTAPPHPVEIKYGKPDSKGVLAFLKKFKAKDGTIITRDKEQTIQQGGKTIHCVPAYKQLLKQTGTKT